MATRQVGVAHCVHHDVHFQVCRGYQGRVEYIKAAKDQDEQEIRLANFWLFPPDILPLAMKEAKAAYDEATAANLPALMEIHTRLVAEQGYVCTWTGLSIFKK